jgi:hypothetical protein
VSCSFKSDHTDFDESRVKDLRRGESTPRDVIALLGSPPGMQAYPLVKNEHDQGLVYAYVHTKLHPGFFTIRTTIYRKILVVTVDGGGTVTDIEFTTDGEP